MIKRSRQREAIRQCLTGRYDHPTAETVYMSIKDEFPNISLGTVYRNLSLLSDLGEVQKITVSGGPDRFVQTADLFLGEYKGGPVEQIAIDKY